jgi:hypothetical protein
MARRLLILLASLVLAAGAAGCAAVEGDAQEALEILERAEQAQQDVESMTFGMRMRGEAAGQTFTIRVDGGGYVKGENAGDLELRMLMEGPGMPPTTMQMVALDGEVHANLDGTWQEIPGGLATMGIEGDGASGLEQQFAGLQLAEYVRDVEVESGTSFLGEPVTKIAGTIATEDLVKAVMGGLTSAGGLGASGLGAELDPSQLLQGVDLDDIRAVLYISDVTSLLRAAHMEFAIQAEGQSMTFEIDMSVRSVNEPVEIAQPAVTA